MSSPGRRSGSSSGRCPVDSWSLRPDPSPIRLVPWPDGARFPQARGTRHTNPTRPRGESSGPDVPTWAISLGNPRGRVGLVFLHGIAARISETRRVRTMHHALRRLQRLLNLLQTGWSIVGITLVVLIVTEAVFRAGFALRDWLGAEPRPDRRVLVEGYGGSTWPVQHYR